MKGYIYLNSFTIPLHIWNQIFNVEKQKLDFKKYPFYVSKYATRLTGCIVNVKGYDVSKNHITIRAYCGHSVKNTFCRLFKLINFNLKFGLFEIFATTLEINHQYIKGRQTSGYAREIYSNLLKSKTSEEVSEMLLLNENKDFVKANRPKN